MKNEEPLFGGLKIGGDHNKNFTFLLMTGLETRSLIAALKEITLKNIAQATHQDEDDLEDEFGELYTKHYADFEAEIASYFGDVNSDSDKSP